MELLRGPLLRSMVTILGLALAACSVGEVETPAIDAAPPNPANIASFMTMIGPLVVPCTGCHGSTQNPVLTSFTTLLPMYYAKPGSSSKLVTKDIDDNTPGMHQGISYLNDTQKMTVSTWIDGVLP